MKVIDVLIKARDRIDKPWKWISYWSVSDDGRRFGADGVIRRATDDDELRQEAIQVLAEFSGINPMWDALDRVVNVDKHRAVMAMFDKAIRSLSGDDNKNGE